MSKRDKARLAPHMGHHSLPDAISDGYNDDRTLCKFAIVSCENGGKIITTERYDKAAREHHYKVYQVPETSNLIEVLTAVLIEERLK